MRINVMSGGSPDLFNAMLFPEATPETQHWLSQQFNRETSMLTDLGRSFMNQATSWFQQLYDPNLMRKARAMVRNIGGVMHPNTIMPIDDLSGLRMARPVMIRYLMSQPELRDLYHRQLCDGYSDTYVDLDPGEVKQDDYNWRRVMNGVVQDITDKDGNPSWMVQMFPDELRPGDRELDHDEQAMILDAWDVIERAIREKEDPSDIFCGKLEI